MSKIEEAKEILSPILKISWNTTYIKTFEANEDKELSISYQIGAKFKNSSTKINELNNTINLENINDETNTEQTLQIDYTLPLGEHKIEVGGKMIQRDQKMDYETNSRNKCWKIKHHIPKV